MRKAIIIGVLFFSCTWPFMPEECQNTVEDCANWCAINIKYGSDKFAYPDEEDEDYWQTYAETKNRMAGDCEDICIVFGKMLHDRGFDSTFYWVIGDLGGHMVVEADGDIWNIGTSDNKARKENHLRDDWYLKFTYKEMVEQAEKYHGYHKDYGELNEDYYKNQ